ALCAAPILTNPNPKRHFRGRLLLSNKRQAPGPGGYRGRGPQCPFHQSPLRLFTRIETVSASSWHALGGAASKLTRPTITAWDCFPPRARPLPPSPWRALGSRE